jgi:LysM repeat protein
MNNSKTLLPLTPVSPPNVRRKKVIITLATILVLHGAVFVGLLLNGCKQKAADTAAGGGTNELGPLTNNVYADTSTNLPGTGMPRVGDQAGTVAQQATNPPAQPPGFGAAQPPAPPIGPSEYSVVQGDSPARIAKAHGVTLDALMNANPGINPRRLQIKQKLVIPAPAPAPAAGAAAAGSGTPAPGGAVAPVGDAPRIHEVKPNENLTKIARQHNVTIKALRAANSLRTDRLHPGQKLKIPPSKAAPATADAGAAAGTNPAGTALTGARQ